MNRDLPNPTARPPLRIPRVSIGQMMAVVAACAALSKSSLGVLLLVLFESVIVLPLVWLVTVIGNELGRHRIAALALTAGVLIAWGVAWAGPLAGADISKPALAVVSGLGLFVVVDRRFHRKPLTSGHLIWAFAGLIWITLPFVQRPRGHGHSPWSVMEFQANLTRLLLAAAILLITFSPRPTGVEDRRTHRAGWLVVECGIILWGWTAFQYTYTR